jgi:K+-transporting ATPase ATPase C chain
LQLPLPFWLSFRSEATESASPANRSTNAKSLATNHWNHTMKKTILTAALYTLITATILGIGYPLAITGIAHLLFPKQAAGELITRNGEIIGSHLIGQAFTGPTYFHSRPSSAGTGYDAGASSGSNLAPTSKALIDRTAASVATEQINNSPVPIDLVTASASGLDPDISPAAALYQIPRIAQERHLSAPALTQLVQQHTTPRQFGLLGEPRVNVLDLNLALDNLSNH